MEYCNSKKNFLLKKPLSFDRGVGGGDYSIKTEALS